VTPIVSRQPATNSEFGGKSHESQTFGKAHVRELQDHPPSWARDDHLQQSQA
jgi:hypothetical protein